MYRTIKKNECFFEYSIGHELHKQILKDILYFESSGRQVKMLTIRSEVFFYGAMNKIYENLQDQGFILIHKSFLVNYNHVISIGTKEVTVSNGEHLDISQRHAQKVKETFAKIERQRMN